LDYLSGAEAVRVLAGAEHAGLTVSLEMSIAVVIVEVPA
jgi:hypothetical protein